MYSVFELIKLPITKVEVEILDIDLENKAFVVEGNTRLNTIYYNEYTEGTETASLKAGDIIIVEYDDLFDGYNPYSVYGNHIELKLVTEES